MPKRLAVQAILLCLLLNAQTRVFINSRRKQLVRRMQSIAAMVFNRMVESDDDEAATLESILDPFVRNKTLSASAAEAFCKKGTGGVVWKTPGEENTFLATFISPL